MFNNSKKLNKLNNKTVEFDKDKVKGLAPF